MQGDSRLSLDDWEVTEKGDILLPLGWEGESKQLFRLRFLGDDLPRQSLTGFTLIAIRP
jgi:hypothetical protein